MVQSVKMYIKYNQLQIKVGLLYITNCLQKKNIEKF